MNDEERRRCVLNDEGLYDAYRRTKLSVMGFVRRNRRWIDEAVIPIVSGRKPAHYLKYDPTIASTERTP